MGRIKTMYECARCECKSTIDKDRDKLLEDGRVIFHNCSGCKIYDNEWNKIIREKSKNLIFINEETEINEGILTIAEQQELEENGKVTRICVDCGNSFYITEEKIKFLEESNYVLPKRCIYCKKVKTKSEIKNIKLQESCK